MWRSKPKDRTISSVKSGHLTSVIGGQPPSALTEPFGYTSTSGVPSSNALQYTGRENDGLQLYYYRARYYSPRLQRFFSEDPLGFRGGDINLYAYVGQNPMGYIDPQGLFVAGLGGGGSYGAFGVVDTTGGFVADLNGNVSAFAYGGISNGPQFAASRGGSILVAPFAQNISNIAGVTLDLQLRLGVQLTISVPVDLNIANTAFTFDFPPGINLGIGWGTGYTWVGPGGVPGAPGSGAPPGTPSGGALGAPGSPLPGGPGSGALSAPGAPGSGVPGSLGKRK